MKEISDLLGPAKLAWQALERAIEARDERKLKEATAVMSKLLAEVSSWAVDMGSAYMALHDKFNKLREANVELERRLNKDTRYVRVKLGETGMGVAYQRVDRAQLMDGAEDAQEYFCQVCIDTSGIESRLQVNELFSICPKCGFKAQLVRDLGLAVRNLGR